MELMLPMTWGESIAVIIYYGAYVLCIESLMMYAA